MSFVSEALGGEGITGLDGDIQDRFDDIRGKTGERAAAAAALAQQKAVEKALRKSKRSNKKILKSLKAGESGAIDELQPFSEAGLSALAEIQGVLTDPTKAQDFVSNNPFFKALQDDAQRRLFNNEAARGKVGSGGTAQALQNSTLLLGDQLMGADSALGNLANMGQRASFGIADIRAGGGVNRANALTSNRNNLIDLITQRGNAQAAGFVGRANATQQGVNNGIEIGKTVGSFFGGGGSDTPQTQDISGGNNASTNTGTRQYNGY